MKMGTMWEIKMDKLRELRQKISQLVYGIR
jgi:hypothetical protein